MGWTEELRSLCFMLSDDDLFKRLESGVVGERAHLVETLAILGELQARKAALPRGFPSLFMYCRRVLGYCERTAYRRLVAARAARRYPEVLERLRSGRLHLSAVVLLQEHMNDENHLGLLDEAGARSIDELKKLCAIRSPLPVAPKERVRIIAIQPSPCDTPRPTEAERPRDLLAPTDSLPLQTSTAEPAACQIRIELRFTITPEIEAKLARARRMLSHRAPRGELELIFNAALDALLEDDAAAERPERAVRSRTPSASRRIPARIKREVRRRDGDRCAFVSADGRRCEETMRLQFDHVRPHWSGGRSDRVENIRLLCAAHNRWRMWAPPPALSSP